jgi:hypothetical protein
MLFLQAVIFQRFFTNCIEMRKLTFAFFLSLICFTIQAQKNKDSVRLLAPPASKNIILPKITDPGFCEKMKLISIPDTSIFRSADDKYVYYLIRLRIVFNKDGKIRSINPGYSSSKIKFATDQISDLLTKSKWSVVNKRQFGIIFKCYLNQNGFSDLVLCTSDESQAENLCKK